MSSIPDLLTVEKGCISAPAGCGKTHLISETLARHSGDKPILVLTHTNAGVAALRKRLHDFDVPKRNFKLSTIDGWAIRLISNFPMRSGHSPETLELQNPKKDYKDIKRFAHLLLSSGHVDEVLKASYSRIFVDEYQDCMKHQHDIVVALSTILPTCVFGDDLQCIFEWSGPKVDWNTEVLSAFPLIAELDTPYRWNNAGCNDLGKWLIDIRPQLRAGDSIDLLDAPAEVEWVQISGSNDHENILKATRSKIPVKNGSLMVICDSKNKQRQQNLAKQTPGAVVVENVDLTDFINFAESFSFESPNATYDLIDFAASVLTGVDRTTMKKRIRSLFEGTARKKASEAEQAALDFMSDPTPRMANSMLVEIAKRKNVRAYRPAILFSCLRTLDSCSVGDDFEEFAIAIREQQRIIGREARGRVVGSTLLLKGLEADVCVVLDTDELSPQDLYVALTRGARKVIVCSERSTI